jgi:hypothetical protein
MSRVPQLEPMRVFDHRHATNCKRSCEKHGLEPRRTCVACRLCSCQQQVVSAVKDGQVKFLDIYTFTYGLSKNMVNDLLMELVAMGALEVKTICLSDTENSRVESTYHLNNTTSD